MAEYKCECPYDCSRWQHPFTGRLREAHEAGKCECTNDIEPYENAVTGVKRYLCSGCRTFVDSRLRKD